MVGLSLHKRSELRVGGGVGGRGGGGMHKAICVKSGGSITNLGSGEGQDEHGEVIRYCTSTRPTKAFSGHRAAVRHRDSGEGNKKKKAVVFL